MANSIIRKVSSRIQGSFFTVMIDETTDMGNVEQVVAISYSMGRQYLIYPHEEFIALYKTESVHVKVLVEIINDCLLHLNLKLEHCRRQSQTML